MGPYAKITATSSLPLTGIAADQLGQMWGLGVLTIIVGVGLFIAARSRMVHKANDKALGVHQ